MPCFVQDRRAQLPAGFVGFALLAAGLSLAAPAVSQAAAQAGMAAQAGISSPPATDLLAPMRAALEARRAETARIASVSPSPEAARAAFDAGDFGRAGQLLSAVPAADSGDYETALLRARLDLASYRFPEFRVDLARLERLAPDHLETHRLEFRWDYLTDNLEAAERRFKTILAADTSDPVALYNAARFQHLTLHFDDAIAGYQRALRHAPFSVDSVRALEGLGACWLQKGDKAAALRYETRAVNLRGADDALLVLLADALIKVGRAREATQALQLALQLNPFNENAHYLLGNGYAPHNYTELRLRDPSALADSQAARELDGADSLWNHGRRDEARARLARVISERTALAQAHVQMGSYAYEDDQPDSALAHFQAALALCPDYGRAQNGIARSLELYRRRVDIHHARYEQEFHDAAWPEIPGIERFVINYASLTPRIQKRVALSVAPWKAFVPVLVEGGSTFYIKHLHEVLSHCPGQELLKDQRISYDLRLWDDVRGCGGYRTVTGIEDVEGTLLGRYNTVLHELSHQVHFTLTADLDREIQELYRRARARMDGGREAFVSLYQASSVYEYLAEGVNSLFTPRRDRFDTRDILRERLEARDPELVAEIRKLMALKDMTPFFPVAYAGAGDDRLEHGRAEEAAAFYRKALERAPELERAQSQLSYALDLQGRRDEAVGVAREGFQRHPHSVELALQLALAEYVRGGDPRARLEVLRAAMPAVDPRERYRVLNDLGRAALDAGLLDSARAAADSLVAYQSDNPEGLELRGEVEALGGRLDSARVYFDRAVGVRSGWLGLRLAYAGALLAASEEHPDTALLGEASHQIEAARLADPLEPGVAMLDGWMAFRRGDDAEALRHLDQALAKADWLHLARILRMRVQAHRNATRPGAAVAAAGSAQAEGAGLGDWTHPGPLRFEYNERQAGYELVGGWTELERRELRKADGRVAR